MFYNCKKLQNLNVSNFECKNIDYFNKYLNKLNILIKAKKDDINTELYFLDNYVEKDAKGKIVHYHDTFQDLCEINCKLYIDGNQQKFSKYFIPEKEGEYNITLTFNINLTNCYNMFSH